jgi:hypothetical protein
MWSWKNAGAAVASAPALIGLDEFRLAIPWRDALQQGPPPLHQPGAVCGKLSSPVEPFAANGKLSLNCLSHPRGQAQIGMSEKGLFRRQAHTRQFQQMPAQNTSLVQRSVLSGSLALLITYQLTKSLQIKDQRGSHSF